MSLSFRPQYFSVAAFIALRVSPLTNGWPGDTLYSNTHAMNTSWLQAMRWASKLPESGSSQLINRGLMMTPSSLRIANEKYLDKAQKYDSSATSTPTPLTRVHRVSSLQADSGSNLQSVYTRKAWLFDKLIISCMFRVGSATSGCSQNALLALILESPRYRSSNLLPKRISPNELLSVLMQQWLTYISGNGSYQGVSYPGGVHSDGILITTPYEAGISRVYRMAPSKLTILWNAFPVGPQSITDGDGSVRRKCEKLYKWIEENGALKYVRESRGCIYVNSDGSAIAGRAPMEADESFEIARQKSPNAIPRLHFSLGRWLFLLDR